MDLQLLHTAYTSPVQRVLVIGCRGSGKTTLTRRIAAERSLPWTSLDSIFWKPGWVETPDAEFIPRVEALCKGDAWVIDGSYVRTLAKRLEYADTVVWLDLPRRSCLWGVTRRILNGYGRVRSEMPEGCAEHLNWSFYKWIWNFKRRHDALYLELLTDWLGRDIERGKCVTNAGASRRAWWVTNRREQALAGRSDL